MRVCSESWPTFGAASSGSSVHRLRVTHRASGGTTPGARSLGSSRRARFPTRPHKRLERRPNASRMIETPSSGARDGEQPPEFRPLGSELLASPRMIIARPPTHPTTNGT
jgi:hypothetical protein